MSRSLAKITRLGVLSREIRRDYDSLLKLVERTRRSCNEVIAETILLGTKLAEAKKLVGHGNWSEWLARHCSEISERTARRYIALANRSHVSDLEKHKSLRQAYLAVGILIPNEEREPKPAVEVALPTRLIAPAAPNKNVPTVQPIIEATVVESSRPANESVAITDTPTSQVKGKVGDLMQCLKPLDVPGRKKVAVHLKPLVIFYHRFGK
jgi:hypothetical protein